LTGWPHRRLRDLPRRRNLIRMSKHAPVPPTRPGTDDADEDATPDEIAIVRERMKTFERDAAAARPWPEVKADVLKRQLRP
jgi:hypothetical protein